MKKDFTKVSRVDLLFNFNLQYWSLYATFNLLAHLEAILSKMATLTTRLIFIKVV